MRVRDEINTTPSASVASARAPSRNELLSAERDRAVAAAAGLNRDFRFVDEHKGEFQGRTREFALQNSRVRPWNSPFSCYSTGWIEMNRPVAPLSSN